MISRFSARCLPLLLLGALGGCASHPAFDVGPRRAGVFVTAELHYYPVRGKTAGDIRSDMHIHNPVPDRNAAAYTDWRLSWEYQVVRGANGEPGCGLRRVHVRLFVGVTLPQWVPPATPDSDLTQAWSAYSAVLRDHEMGHVHRAVQAANDIVTALETVRAPACYLMRTKADQLGRLLRTKMQEEQRYYDSETVHGRLPGAGLELQLSSIRAARIHHAPELPSPTPRLER